MGQVITSGHQPGFHHPGILAKRLALCGRTDSGAEAVWLVADQRRGRPGGWFGTRTSTPQDDWWHGPGASGRYGRASRRVRGPVAG